MLDTVELRGRRQPVSYWPSDWTNNDQTLVLRLFMFRLGLYSSSEYIRNICCKTNSPLKKFLFLTCFCIDMHEKLKVLLSRPEEDWRFQSKHRQFKIKLSTREPSPFQFLLKNCVRELYSYIPRDAAHARSVNDV